jgi:hypothetical protein
LKNNTVIQKVLALAMLLIFAFSITPKKYLHDLVADHTDYYSFHISTEASVGQAGFNCHCDDLVVSTPFIPTAFTTDISLPTLYNEYVVTSFRQFNLSTQYTKDLRGPPAIA